MKRIEACGLHELVRPLFEGFWCDGGGMEMTPDQEYEVVRFLRDGRGREYPPHSSVVVRDGYGMNYTLHFGRIVLERTEALPSVQDLVGMPPESWNNRNKRKVLDLVGEARRDGETVVVRKVHTASDTETRYYILKRIPPSEFPPQAQTLVKIMGELVDRKDGVTQAELYDCILGRAIELNTRQDPWRIFVFYRPKLVEAGIVRIDG